MHESVTENRGNLYGMKAFNKLINNTPGIQIENIYSPFNHLRCLCGKMRNFRRIYESREMQHGLKDLRGVYGAMMKLHVLHRRICFS